MSSSRAEDNQRGPAFWEGRRRHPRGARTPNSRISETQGTGRRNHLKVADFGLTHCNIAILGRERLEPTRFCHSSLEGECLLFGVPTYNSAHRR